MVTYNGEVNNRSLDPNARSHIAALTTPMRNYLQHLKKLVAERQYVIFYGCGRAFRSNLTLWRTVFNRKIDFACDSNPAKWGKYFEGILCISPDELLKYRSTSIVFLTLGDFQPILDFLKREKFASIMTINEYDWRFFLENPQLDLEMVQRNLASAYPLLADERSRLVFDSIVRRTFQGADDFNCTKSCYDSLQYFSADFIPASALESFVDGGAYNGDTLRDFYQITQGRFKNYYAFELNHESFQQLRSCANELDSSGRIQVFECGIGDRYAEVSYSLDVIATSCAVCDSGGGEGRIVPLDSFLQGKPVTFIKMDVEGYELKALAGAKQIIQEKKPVLAICAYHAIEHLWQIPCFIKELVPDYKIYMRCYTCNGLEIVCYAVL